MTVGIIVDAKETIAAKQYIHFNILLATLTNVIASLSELVSLGKLIVGIEIVSFVVGPAGQSRTV